MFAGARLALLLRTVAWSLRNVAVDLAGLVEDGRLLGPWRVVPLLYGLKAFGRSGSKSPRSISTGPLMGVGGL
jgi:hypothetical protein